MSARRAVASLLIAALTSACSAIDAPARLPEARCVPQFTGVPAPAWNSQQSFLGGRRLGKSKDALVAEAPEAAPAWARYKAEEARSLRWLGASAGATAVAAAVVFLPPNDLQGAPRTALQAGQVVTLLAALAVTLGANAVIRESAVRAETYRIDAQNQLMLHHARRRCALGR